MATDTRLVTDAWCGSTTCPFRWLCKNSFLSNWVISPILVAVLVSVLSAVMAVVCVGSAWSAGKFLGMATGMMFANGFWVVLWCVVKTTSIVLTALSLALFFVCLSYSEYLDYKTERKGK